MKRKKKVIDQDNLPVNLPVYRTLILILALDHWQAAEWLWIIAVIIILMMWGYALAFRDKAVSVDIFEEKEEMGNE